VPFHQAGVVWGEASARGAPLGSTSAEQDPRVVDTGGGAPSKASGEGGQLTDHARPSRPLA
jgi:hypothetical protein